MHHPTPDLGLLDRVAATSTVRVEARGGVRETGAEHEKGEDMSHRDPAFSVRGVGRRWTVGLLHAKELFAFLIQQR